MIDRNDCQFETLPGAGAWPIRMKITHLPSKITIEGTGRAPNTIEAALMPTLDRIVQTVIDSEQVVEPYYPEIAEPTSDKRGPGRPRKL